MGIYVSGARCTGPPPPTPPISGWLAGSWLGGWLALAEIGDVLWGFAQVVGSLWLVTGWLHLHAGHMVVTGKLFTTYCELQPSGFLVFQLAE